MAVGETFVSAGNNWWLVQPGGNEMRAPHDYGQTSNMLLLHSCSMVPEMPLHRYS